MTKEEIIETINKMMAHGMENYNEHGTTFWDGWTEALDVLMREIDGENL